MTDAPDSPYKTLSTKTAYKSPWLEVEENQVIHPDGHEGIFNVIKRKNSVSIVPVDADGKLLLIHIFSYGAQKWRWEFPSGRLDDGEEFLTAAERELQEETGFTAAHFEQIGLSHPFSRTMTGLAATVLATDLKSGEIPPADDNGVISDQKFFTLDQVNDMVQKGEINNTSTITALHYYALHQQRSTK
ncbi:NUDIX hydrolase [Candidatus Saccharibacteria bacterium]|nr:NUDIX hydrolase [Candidatus Saccharibacteria bacterium]